MTQFDGMSLQGFGKRVFFKDMGIPDRCTCILGAAANPLNALLVYSRELAAKTPNWHCADAGSAIQVAYQYSMLRTMIDLSPGGVGAPHQLKFINESKIGTMSNPTRSWYRSMYKSLERFSDYHDGRKEGVALVKDDLAAAEKFVAEKAIALGKVMKSDPSYLAKIEKTVHSLFNYFSCTCHWITLNPVTHNLNMTYEQYVASIGEVNQKALDTCDRYFKQIFSRNWLAGAKS